MYLLNNPVDMNSEVETFSDTSEFNQSRKQ